MNGLRVVNMVWFGLLFSCTPKSTTDPAAPSTDSVAEMPWSPPSEWGPFPVGADTIEWVDSRGKKMTAEVWFPALDEEGAELRPYAPLTLTAKALRHVDPDTRFGPYPLVAFSHGFGGIRFQSIFLTEYLASHGFVVVSPDHQYNTFLDLNGEHLVQVILERPGDVVESVDEIHRLTALEDEDLYGMVSPGEYAVVGHSFGALTSLIVGGGEIDLDGARARCQTHSAQLCGQVAQISDEDIAAHTMSDDRAVVTVPMSPGVWYAFGPDGESAPGLQTVRQPLLLVGDLDDVLDYPDEPVPVFTAMSSHKVLATFHGAGHYGFSDICALAPFLSEECRGSNDGWMDVDDVQQLSRSITLAHIRRHLVGDVRDEPWLAENALHGEPRVTVERQ
jgi:predicted dienelactone hydrolase